MVYISPGGMYADKTKRSKWTRRWRGSRMFDIAVDINDDQ